MKKKTSTKVPLIPGTKHPVPEITCEWMDDEPGEAGTETRPTIVVITGLNDPDGEYRREPISGPAFDLIAALGAEPVMVLRQQEKDTQQAGNKKRREASRKRDLAAAAARHRGGEIWKVIAADFNMSPDGLRKAVKAAGIQKRRVKAGGHTRARF